jgi:hypothetical protein
MARILAVGHSHAWALARAARSPGFDLRGHRIEFPVIGSKSTPGGLLVEDGAGGLVLNPSIEAASAACMTEPERFLLSSLYGNGHFWLTAAEHSEPFDIICPAIRRPVPGDRRILPRRLIIDVFKRTDAQLPELFRRMKALGFSRMVQVSAPPPPGTPGTAIREKLQKHGAAPAHPLLVLKVWHCQTAALRELCAEAGAVFVEPPEEAISEEGFSRDEWLVDGMHGTTDYARLALAKALDALKAAS